MLFFKQQVPQQTKRQDLPEFHSTPQPFCKSVLRGLLCLIGKIFTEGFFLPLPKLRQLRKYYSHLTTMSSHLILFQITVD